MEILISWSGPASKSVGLAIQEWLPVVLPFTTPWLSEDISKGKRWPSELEKRLEESSYCVVSITPGVEREPWVNFEVGAIAKIASQSNVSPLLVGVSIEDLDGLPLSLFQCTQFTKDDVRKLLESINEAALSGVGTQELTRNHEYAWDRFGQTVEAINVTVQAEETSQNNGHDQDLLEEAEEDILAVLAAMPEDALTLDDLARKIGENEGRTQHHLNVLVKARFLDDRTALLKRDSRMLSPTV
ncbi:TIR domain-containing protein [Candidatus Palauibacter sp.]|uniref:TIR domain-containing protein n=1 Tax=Candidatus Palauibacter sp. TaxID=3101350 RepID=UPI003B51566D